MAARISLKQIKDFPDGLHRIEKGLYVYAHGSTRSWMYCFSFGGKQRRMGLGSAIDVPLAVAKQKKDQAQAVLLTGLNPIEERKKSTADPEEAGPILFKDFWYPIYERIREVKRWKNHKHGLQWIQSIEDYALPVIGSVPVESLTREDILKVLRPIWTTKNETASRLRGRLETILGYAIVEGILKGGNPAAWKSNLDLFLASSTDVQTVKHHETISHAFLKEHIRDFNCKRIGHALIVFTILTAGRIGETAPAKWSEIDFEKKIWSVPPERRKDKKKEPHRVPLSDAAVELLEGLPRSSEFVFPGTSGNPHVSKETPRALLIKKWHRPCTIHGMRSTFRDWCAEVGVREVVAEKCLMHAVGSEVQQAYQRSDLLEQRREVMQAWADYLFKD